MVATICISDVYPGVGGKNREKFALIYIYDFIIKENQCCEVGAPWSRLFMPVAEAVLT